MLGVEKAVSGAIQLQGPIADRGVGGGGNSSPLSGPPFSGVLKSMVQQTQALDKSAGEAVTGLLNGAGVEIHDVMIASQKANVAFELALQVRNKAVAAYQQLMGMQF